MIVAFEGLDASGKNTQSKRVFEWLSSLYGDARFQAFPDYETDTGKAILGLLREDWWPSFPTMELASGHNSLRSLLIQVLMTQNRYEKFGLLSECSRSPDKHLVLDRYFMSGLAYGEADGLSAEYLTNIHLGLPPADIWILLDISAEESVRRRPSRRDEYEKRAGFLEVVREKYLDLFRSPRYSGRTVIVNGMGDEETVFLSIIGNVIQHMEGDMIYGAR